MDDKSIIDLFFNRNEDAIKETERKYGKLCFGIAKNILSNDQDAEECVNDTYLGAWNSIPPERPKNFMAYISRIARNIALKRYEYYTADKRNAYELVSLHELEEVLADEDAPDALSEEELGEILNDFLRNEKEDARNVFVRKYWYFDSLESIAQRYSFSITKVKSMLFHTRNRLKSYLKTRGIYV